MNLYPKDSANVLHEIPSNYFLFKINLKFWDKIKILIVNTCLNTYIKHQKNKILLFHPAQFLSPQSAFLFLFFWNQFLIHLLEVSMHVIHMHIFLKQGADCGLLYIPPCIWLFFPMVLYWAAPLSLLGVSGCTITYLLGPYIMEILVTLDIL